MKVLSLFDVMSCGHIALDKAGIEVTEYYAAEIKEIAIKVTKANYPETIHIGDVNKISYRNGTLYTEKGSFNVGHIDLVMFGSPCQTFSIAMKTELRIGLKDKQKSGLFLECFRILQEVNPTYFLMENVARMKKEDENFITQLMGVEPIRINSKLVSAQLRDRLYWTNIPNVTAPQDKGIKLQDILTSGYTDREKARALLVSDSRPLTTKSRMLHRYINTGFSTLIWEEKDNDNSIRYMNQTELERCQTVPEGYTFAEAGLILTQNGDQIDDLKLENVGSNGIVKVSSKLTTSGGLYSYTLSMGSSSRPAVSAKPMRLPRPILNRASATPP